MVTPAAAYLRPSAEVDSTHPSVKRQAALLAASDPMETARRCFEWVRDEVEHTGDSGRSGPITCAASEVLAAGTGFCFAKSHLLAALLRANSIPAALCYQRFARDGETGRTFNLHGLNAVELPGIGWYRVDARGNRPGEVDTQFDPPRERLAFAAPMRDFLRRFAKPLPVVIAALRAATDAEGFEAALPDWEGTPLSEARNFGSLTRTELEAIGFRTLEDLVEAGWQEACARWAEAIPGRANVNAIRAMIGAIDDCDWRQIDQEKRKEAVLFAAKLRGSITPQLPAEPFSSPPD